MAQGRKKTVSDTVEKWLHEEGMDFESINDVYADMNLKVKTDALTVHVSIPKDKIDSLLIQTAAAFSEEEKKQYAALRDEEKKRDYGLDLKDILFASNVKFWIEPDSIKPERVQIAQVIYFDGITKDRFFDVFWNVARAAQRVVLVYGKHFRLRNRGSSSFGFFL